jgi:hypothetical protein
MASASRAPGDSLGRVPGLRSHAARRKPSSRASQPLRLDHTGETLRWDRCGTAWVRKGSRRSTAVQSSYGDVWANPLQSIMDQLSRPTFNHGVPGSIPGGPPINPKRPDGASGLHPINEASRVKLKLRSAGHRLLQRHAVAPFMTARSSPRYAIHRHDGCDKRRVCPADSMRTPPPWDRR